MESTLAYVQPNSHSNHTCYLQIVHAATRPISCTPLTALRALTAQNESSAHWCSATTAAMAVEAVSPFEAAKYRTHMRDMKMRSDGVQKRRLGVASM